VKDLHLADFRAGRIGTDHENEGIHAFDPAQDLFHPIRGGRDILPIHPDILTHIRQGLNNLSGGDGVFSRIGYE
jgi:hypothetical protein